MLEYRQLRWMVIMLTLSLSACAAPQFPTERAAMPYPPNEKFEVGTILHTATGTLVSQATMLSIVSENRIVYVGETHDNPAAHRLQLDVLKSMAARYPGKVTIGMEMFTPAQQLRRLARTS